MECGVAAKLTHTRKDQLKYEPEWAGYRLVTGWLPAGYRLVTGWLQAGYLLVTCWLQAGYRLVTGWLPAGYRLVTGWLLQVLPYHKLSVMLMINRVRVCGCVCVYLLQLVL